jgi:hypothetical protein
VRQKEKRKAKLTPRASREAFLYPRTDIFDDIQLLPASSPEERVPNSLALDPHFPNKLPLLRLGSLPPPFGVLLPFRLFILLLALLRLPPSGFDGLGTRGKEESSRTGGADGGGGIFSSPRRAKARSLEAKRGKERERIGSRRGDWEGEGEGVGIAGFVLKVYRESRGRGGEDLFKVVAGLVPGGDGLEGRVVRDVRSRGGEIDRPREEVERAGRAEQGAECVRDFVRSRFRLDRDASSDLGKLELSDLRSG